MRKWALGLTAVVIILILVAVLYPVYTSPVQKEGFSAYGKDWNDLSELRSVLDRETRTIITTPAMLGDIQHPQNSVLFIIGMEKAYSDLEVDAVADFVAQGGNLVLANNNELANPISEKFGVRFYSENVLDPAFMNLDVRNMSIYQHNATLDGDNYTVQFNSPAGLEVEEGRNSEIICSSSTNSSLDLNGNGLRDLSDKRGPIPLIAMTQRNEEGGMAVFISSPSVFINQEIVKVQNLNFSKNLVDYLLDWNQESSTDVVVGGEDTGEPLIIFEESRHVSTRDRQVVYNIVTILAYLSKHPIMAGVVIVNLLCIALFWWLANPRPKPFRHTDRLGDTNPREKDLNAEQLREILILKMVDTPPIQEDHTILSADDLKERLKKIKIKKVKKILRDEELVNLLIEKKIGDLNGLKKKVYRWEYNVKRNKK